MEMEGCIRSDANLGPEFWEFSIGFAVYLLTRRPHSALENRMTPYEAWLGRKPTIAHYRAPGCDAWYHVPKHQRKKLQFKGKRAIFIGYANNQKAYKLWDPSLKQVIISRAVLFNEKSFTFGRSTMTTNLPPPNRNSPTFVQDDDHQSRPEKYCEQHCDLELEEAVQHEHIPIAIDEEDANRRHSTRTRPPIDYFVPGALTLPVNANEITVSCNDNYPRPSLANMQASDIALPRSLFEALQGPYAGHWFDSAKAEIDTLNRFGTLKLTALPLNRKAIGSKFVFKVKSKPDGTVEKFKTRLCGKGYSQRAGLDYSETFSPVAHSESIRVLLALAAQNKLHLRQIDIVGAFLNGTLDETIYMKQPEGITQAGNKDLVYLLVKALYGLKQSGRVWNKRFDKFMTETLRFSKIKSDPCVYIKHFPDHKFQMFGLHVDDIIMSHNDLSLADKTVIAIEKEFETTDKGMPELLLGMKITRSSATGPISIDQTSYIEQTVKRFRMEDCKPTTTPHLPNFHFSKSMCPATESESEAMKHVPYSDLLGSLLWIALQTRPDIAQAVGVLCRFASNPGEQHWTGLKRILRYLAHTKSFGIRYSSSDTPLFGYSDSDYANCPDTRRSTTGYCFIQSNGPIAWKSKLQKSKGSLPGVATSSVTAEYQALYDACRETAWLRQLYCEIGSPLSAPTVIYEDNQGAISMAHNNRTDSLTKHISVKYHYTREMVQENQVVINYCETARMVADFLTKPTDTRKFLWCREQIGVVDLNQPINPAFGLGGHVETQTSASTPIVPVASTPQ
jgi:hypothetical protein